MATLTQVFLGENQSFRRRRDAVYSDVYVEQFVYVGDETSTNVVFAVAEKPRYYLISASEACKLLMNTEVKCLADDDGNNSAKKGEGDSEGDGFPVWIIYIIAAVLIILVLIIALVVFCRRRANKVCAFLMCFTKVKKTQSCTLFFSRVSQSATMFLKGEQTINLCFKSCCSQRWRKQTTISS